MLTKLTLIVAALLLCPVAITSAAQIIVVTENVDKNLDRVADDQGLIDWLVAEGHSVDVRRNTWDQLDAKLIAQLNAADLIIVSRLANSGLYIHGDETTQWNSLKTPLLLMSAYFARNMRWNWVNSAVATNDTGDIYAVAVDPNHPVFRGIQLRPLDPNDPRDHTQVVQLVDPNVGSGITSFIGATDMGNGRLIARSVGHALGWIAEWDAGAEFYPGAGQFAGGKRMMFMAGTQDVSSSQGEFNLNEAGQQLLRNVLAWLLAEEQEQTNGQDGSAEPPLAEG